MTDELEELAQKLEAMDPDSDEAVALNEAIAEYRAADDPSGEDHDSLLERLGDAAISYESSHPELSAFVAKVVDSLSAAGI